MKQEKELAAAATLLHLCAHEAKLVPCRSAKTGLTVEQQKELIAAAKRKAEPESEQHVAVACPRRYRTEPKGLATAERAVWPLECASCVAAGESLC